MSNRTLRRIAAVMGLLVAPLLAAIEFDEVRDYADVFVISGAAPSS